MRMRWASPVTLALIAALAAGCTGTAAPAAAPAATTTTTTPTTTASPAAEPAPATDSTAGDGVAKFVQVVQEKVPEIAVDRRDEEIGAIALTACASLKAGKDTDTIVDEARSLGTANASATDYATANELIKLAIDTVCLDQKDRVDEF